MFVTRSCESQRPQRKIKEISKQQILNLKSKISYLKFFSSFRVLCG